NTALTNAAMPFRAPVRLSASVPVPASLDALSFALAMTKLPRYWPMFRLLQALVAAVLAFFAYQYVSQHHRPTPARQTLTAVDSSDSKPPEAWKYGSPVQRQLYEDYWEK